MRRKNKKIIFTPPFHSIQRIFHTERVGFICQITETHLKVIKCSANKSKGEFLAFEVEAVSADIDDKTLTEKIKLIFDKLQYSENPVIVSLPRNNVTCRYLKIPSKVPEEIEGMANLQALHYLPYPLGDLINGYQIIQTDKEGYSHINLIIAHKNVIERYIKIFKELKAARLNIILSSYGLANFYEFITKEDEASVMLIDIDYSQAELAIIRNKKLYFSRSFKLNRNQPDWENLFIEQINKTRDVYLKEFPNESLNKIVIFGTGRISAESVEILNRQLALPVEALPYSEKIKLSDNSLNSVFGLENSFVSLIGLAFGTPEESLNLLPQDVKEKNRKISQGKESLKIILLILGIILISSIGIANNLKNKAGYLMRLKMELQKITKEAKPLEDIEKRFEILENRSQKTPTNLLDLFYELHQIMPDEIYLVSFSYEEGNQVTLRGQTPELNSVFNFVSFLEKSPAFKNFNIKVRYATQKKTQGGEAIDFEIIALKEK